MSSDHLNWSAVVSYCELGIRVFPIVYQSKVPLLRANWKEIATCDVSIARQLFPLDNHWNIGIALGPGSNLLDIEADSEASNAALEEAFELFGRPHTPAYRSSRGIHYWFKWNQTLGQFGKSVIKWCGVECRLGTGDKGAYSVIPPSMHESGKLFYQWLPGQAPWEIPIMEMPHWMEALWVNAQDHRESRSVVEVTRQGDDFLPAPGQRHPYLVQAGNLVYGSLRLPRDVSEEILFLIADYTGKVADRGFEETQKEVKDIIRTAVRPNLPHEDFPAIDFEAMRETAKDLVITMREDVKYTPPSPGIPSHIFPPFFQEFSEQAHKAQYSRDFVLMSMLGTVSAALGNSIRVRHSQDAGDLGVQFYSLGVANASTGKSLVINHMTTPVCIGEGFCTDATPEALIKQMHTSPRGVLLKVTEGSGLTKMLGRYNQSGSDDMPVDNAVLQQAWSGEQIKVIRKSGNIDIQTPFLSIVAATQPYGLECFGVNDCMNGFMQRLFLYPSPDVPEDTDLVALKCIREMFQIYSKLAERLKTVRPCLGAEMPGGTNIPPPEGIYVPPPPEIVLPSRFILEPESFRCWRSYAKAKRSRKSMAEFPDGHPFQMAKLRHGEIALRIAALFHSIIIGLNDALWEASQIHTLPEVFVSVEALQRALDLVEHGWECMQELMTNIADDRYNTAVPMRAAATSESMPIYLEKFVFQRRKKLERVMKSTDPWSIRDYYRYLHLHQQDAETEIEIMLRMGYVAHAGVRHKSNVFVFVDKEKPVC